MKKSIIIICTVLLLILPFFQPEIEGKSEPDQSAEKKAPEKKLKRAILEWAGLMAFSQTNYWVKYTKWIEDWQFELTWEDQKKRFFSFEASKFDSNCFQTNWTHALAGAVYFNFARSNHLTLLESSVFTVIASLYWEYIVEWREVVSVNDNILTGIGGISIGEALFQLGSYFAGQKGTGATIGRILSNPILTLNRWLDRNSPYVYQIPKKRRLELSAGILNLTSGDTSQWRGGFGFHSQLSLLPDLTPGKHASRIKSTALSEIYFDSSISFDGVETLEASANIVFSAKFRQDIKEKTDQFIVGSSSLFGFISAYDFYKEKSVSQFDQCEEYKYIEESDTVETPTNYRDKFAAVNIIGPYFEWNRYSGFGKFHLNLSATIDFALVNAFALNEYSESHDISYSKATLYNYGYHYAFGFTLKSFFSYSRAPYQLNLLAKYQYYDSIEGMDRFWDKVTNDLDIKDGRLLIRPSVEFHLKKLPIGIELGYEYIHRTGDIEGFKVKKSSGEIFLKLKLRL